MPDQADFSSMPSSFEQPYLELSVAHSPLRLSGRMRLTFTCSPSGAQTLLYGGIAQ